MFVLGIDPGLTRCGYGCLEWSGPNRVRAVAAGVVRTEHTEELAKRLATMQREITELIAEYKPSVVAIERVLFQVNVSTAMAVGHASGVVMAAAATAGCDVRQYSPNEIKLAVTGYGNADKQQVERMVRAQLKLEKELKPVDAADAIAVALCHTAIVGVPPVSTGVRA
ncbi:MAG: crossover junction endodeoxyribonuclease RuvC [Verrucomicrobiales bacterium]|jgi:crossover junction endodeoxyribonuclease RuvC